MARSVPARPDTGGDSGLLYDLAIANTADLKNAWRVRDVDLLLAALAFAGLLVDPVVEGHTADVTASAKIVDR
jgi:hypothetical protein